MIVRIVIAVEFSLFIVSAIVGIASGSISGDTEDMIEATMQTFVILNLVGVLIGIAALVWRWAV